MPLIYGTERSAEEVSDFVHQYVSSVKARKNGRYKAITGFMPEGGARVLDFGCGWGYYAVAAAEKGNSVLGIDLSDNEIEISRIAWSEKSGENLAFEHVDARSLPDKSFDTVISTSVLEHVHNPGMYLATVNRLLVVGGTLVLSTPNVMTPRNARGAISRNLERSLRVHSRCVAETYRKESRHIQAWDAYHLVALCATMGFEVQRFRPAEGIPLPRIAGRSRYWNTQLRLLQGFNHILVFEMRKTADKSVELVD